MPVSLPKGLKHLPVTSCLIITNVTIPVILSLVDIKYYLDLKFNPQIYKWHQYYRILINGLSFLNELQVMLSSILFYYFRCLERHKSPVNFLSNLMLIYFYNIIFVTLSNLLFKLYLLENLNVIQYLNYSAGPFCLIGALLCDYNIKIPVVYQWLLSGILPGRLGTRILLSDKTFLYFLCFQLFISDGISSIVPSIQGYLICILLNLEILPGIHWQAPLFKKVHRIYCKATSTGFDPLRDSSNGIEATNTELPGSDSDSAIYADDGVDPSRVGVNRNSNNTLTSGTLAGDMLDNIGSFDS